MAVLSASQAAQYESDGFLLVPGLVLEEIAQAAEAAMWREMSADPADPSTWSAANRNFAAVDSPEMVACYTPEYCAAAAQLAGDDPAGFAPPKKAFIINTFPTQAEWKWPHPHIDHAIKEHGYRVFPRAFRIAAMTFLSDVETHGGGTIVWPGSHKQLEALAKSDPEKYALMWSLNQDIDRAGLNPPLEMTPRRGDVLFYHYLCAHAGSQNVTSRPRLALNMKW
jgi:hypothetical protein